MDKKDQTNLTEEVIRLGRLLQELFPAELGFHDMTNPEDILLLARELLTRLYRWEN